MKLFVVRLIIIKINKRVMCYFRFFFRGNNSQNTEPPALHHNRFKFNISNKYCFWICTPDGDVTDSLGVSCMIVLEWFEFRGLAEILIVGAEIEGSRDNTAQTWKAICLLARINLALFLFCSGDIELDRPSRPTESRTDRLKRGIVTNPISYIL